MPKGTDDPIATYNRYESMECADDEDGSDDEVGLESTTAAIHAQLNPGGGGNGPQTNTMELSRSNYNDLAILLLQEHSPSAVCLQETNLS